MSNNHQRYGLIHKLKNRRVSVIHCGDHFHIEFKRLRTHDELETLSKEKSLTWKDKIEVTNLSLSEEALESVISSYYTILKTERYMKRKRDPTI